MTDTFWETAQKALPDPLGDKIRRLQSDRLLHDRDDADCGKHPGSPWRECAECRLAEEAEETALLVRQANERCDERFPIRYRSARTQHPAVLGWIEQMRQGFRDVPSLLLLGPTGTGKTYQAYSALRGAVSIAYRVIDAQGRETLLHRTPTWTALTFADLCASLRPRGRDHDPETVLENYRKTQLLFIDDLGAAKASDWVEEATYRLINGRYEDMRPAIFTTNLALPELKNAIGDRIASRLAETCTRVVLDGPDRRRTKKEN